MWTLAAWLIVILLCCVERLWQTFAYIINFCSFLQNRTWSHIDLTTRPTEPTTKLWQLNRKLCRFVFNHEGGIKSKAGEMTLNHLVMKLTKLYISSSIKTHMNLVHTFVGFGQIGSSGQYYLFAILLLLRVFYCVLP